VVGGLNSVPLVLVGTPIGNMGDLAPRAVAALAAADCICCEDTRRTGRLLQLAGIGRRDGVPLVRVDDHTEAGRVEGVLDRVRRGESVVVVTDAGMPGIADPGERLVAAAVEAGLPVEVVPGPSAVVTALVASGLPTGRYVFEGFLPRQGRDRTDRLAEVAAERRTLVLYESPHRLARTLEDLGAACGPERRAAVGRELTKLHEEVRRGGLGELAAWATASEPPGECVIVVEGAPPAAPASEGAVEAAVLAALADGLSAKDAAAQVAAQLDVPKRVAYSAAVAASRLRSTGG
jgi:16S rRNA (cytidine1402-2'-O)-methyltransferase